MSDNNQLMVVSGQAITKKDIMSAIDHILEQLNQTGNINQAVNVLNGLDKVDNVVGKAKAKLLCGMHEWYKQNNPSEDFADYVESTSSTKRTTVLRYINVWKQIEDENIPKNIQERPMRELVPIANMLEQGYEPSKEQWTSIHLASNPSELSEVLRDIKGQEPRKSGLTITMERDGSLYCHRDKKRWYIGFLTMDDQDENVLKAQERIIQGAQIVRK